MTDSKCRGSTAAANAGLCQSCSRHDPNATGYVLVPFVRERYLLGHDFVTCDDRLSEGSNVARLTCQVSGVTVRNETGRKRFPLVLGALLIAVSSALFSVSANAMCTWANPGANPYTGDKAEAVRRLEGIPAGTRERLAELVAARAGRHVVVTRDQIDGGRYVGLRDMNFGSGRICPGEIDRSMWPVNHQEGAMVFQEGKFAVLWFSRCGNVAWAMEPNAKRSEQQIKEELEITAGSVVNTVSEPDTQALIGAALIAVFVAMRKAR